MPKCRMRLGITNTGLDETLYRLIRVAIVYINTSLYLLSFPISINISKVYSLITLNYLL